MNSSILTHSARRTIARGLVLAGTSTALLLIVGCNRSSTADQPVVEIRGSPILSGDKKVPTTPEGAPITADAQIPSGQASSQPVASANGVPPPNRPPPPSTAGEPGSISFEQLAGYTFEISDDLLGPITNDVAVAEQKTNSQIPETVKAFNQKKIALRGFMLPLKVEGGLVTEMLIMKDQSMCCYGTTPRINDWVSVKMRNKGVRPMMDLPVTLRGTLRVGEMRENGYLVGIYSMEGEAMDAPEAE
jgi:hypothetical protein